jgi:hypothetical protein
MIDLTTLPAWAKDILRCVQIARGLTLRRSPKPAFRKTRRKPLAWRAASLSGLAAAGPTVVTVVSSLTGLAASANVASVALTRTVMGGAVRWTDLGLTFLEAWDAIDLGELRRRAAAALYADRPEITSRVSWEALRELSAPSLPWQVRQKTRSRHRRRQYTAPHDENMPCGEVGDGPLKRVPTYRRESRAFVYISCR